MEEDSGICNRQFSPLGINCIVNNAPALLCGQDANQHYITPPGGVDSLFPPAPQWMYCQQTPQNYVEFHAERAYLEFQKQISCKISTQILPTLGQADPSYLKQSWSEECGHVFREYLGSGGDASKRPFTTHQKRSREKAYAADRFRRLKISRWLDALREVVPRTKEGGKEALLDDVINHVKYLQYLVKDLCQSRFAGDSASNSLMFIEGHGHYIFQEQMLYGPLEETMGKLINAYPSAASELLQSKGLIVMPITFAEGLLESMQMLETQVEGALPISK